MGIMRMACQHYGLILSLFVGVLANYWLNDFTNSTDCSITGDRVPTPTSQPPNEFHPKVNLAGKPLKPKKVPKTFVRPRYYSTELGIRERLFMGIMTTESTVRSLAVAANKTTSHYVDKLMFFMDAAGAEKAQVINLRLPGIVGFVDAREILKPFHMLKYLTDNFLEEYDFFFLTKDTTYVNPHLLLDIVKSISVSQDVHYGFLQPYDASLYCSLDSGILLSNSILKRIRTSLDWCVKNAFSDSDDDNFGRCILHASQLPCKNMTLHGKPLETINVEGTGLDDIGKLGMDNVVSYFPLKKEKMIYNLHLLLSKKVLDLSNRKLDTMERLIDSHELAWPPGSYPPKIPASRFDVSPWQYFDLDKIYMTSDFVTVNMLVGAEKADIMDIVRRTVNWAISQYPELVYQNLVNGYRRFDPSRGADYILDMSFSDNMGNSIIKSFEICKELGKVEMLPMPYVTENGRVHILLPLYSSDYQAADTFMTKYAQSCSQVDLTFLILILLYEPDAPGKGHTGDVFKNVKTRAVELSAKKIKDCKITWISIRIPRIDGEDAPMEDHLVYFAMMDLVSKKLPGDSLILLTEPYVELKSDFMNRVRMGTIINKQVYSPIPFSEYDPKLVYVNTTIPNKPLEIHKNSGRFDVGNIRHISFYMNDYLAARRNITYLPVVKGDKDIVKMFSSFEKHSAHNKITSILDMFSRSFMSVLRAAEPALRLRRASCMSYLALKRTTSFRRCDAPMGTRSQLGQAVLDLEAKNPS
uniref:Hexosyltransferase n=2 Tax=Lygus hesperus TaxID=30085 RepID=A0A0A9YFR8_LYGHE